ncbi:MAG TPA: TetR/AcrR family transcriptional regulator [Micromonosporaceae bacterium]
MPVRQPGFGRVGTQLRERAREMLLDTALRLFVERGYVGVRVEDIARAAGISRATFYKHFSEREEILAELFSRLMGREPVEPPPGTAADAPGRIRALLLDAAERMVEHEQLARFVYTLPIRHAALLGEGSRPPVIEVVERLVEEGAAAGVIRSDIPATLITGHLARAFEAAMRDWAEGRAVDVTARLDQLLRLAFEGTAGAPPSRGSASG